MKRKNKKKKEQNKKWYEKNKEKRKEYNKQYREDNKEKIKQHKKEFRKNNKEKINEYQKQYRKDNPEIFKKFDFMKTYKMLVDCDLEILYKNYLAETHCDFCCMPFTEWNDHKYKNKYVKCLDHDHTTNKFRNFLCVSCNFKRR